MMADQEQSGQQAEAQGQPPAAAPAGVSNTEQQPPEQTVPYARFKEVNDRLKALEDEQAKAAKQRDEEDSKKLAEQQQWQQLAEKRQAKVDELSTKAELADRLSAMVAEQYQAEIKDWPQQVKDMAPHDEADILTKLEWMRKAKPLALELLKEAAPPAGNGRRPPAAGPSGSQQPKKIEPIYDVRRNF